MGINRNADDLLAIPKPIAAALDRVQSDHCGTGMCVIIWKDLMSQRNDVLTIPEQKII